LTLETHEDVRAISPHAWFSLGRHGVGLHFEHRPGVTGEVTVLARAARGKRWEVQMDGKVRERFSSLEAAVEAVDFELSRRGPRVLASALEGAPWRRGVDGELRLVVWQRVTSHVVGKPSK
jgi:hypothetical protein